VGGHVALNISEYSDQYKIAGFLDDDLTKIGTEQFGYKVFGDVSNALDLQDAAVVLGIAFPRVKRTIAERLTANNELVFPTLIHPQAWVSRDVTLGQGSIIYPGTTINYGSTVGDFVVINMNCALGHHTSIGGYSSLAPGVNTGGHTTVGEGVELGIGASTLQDVRIGVDSIVGGQSMVTKNVQANTTVIGVPAKPIANYAKASTRNY
jgi:sugar O-acyltransferase (sialic acid O-acetyltransferase NeuD family)